jgi:hypothetical protein
MDDANVLVVAVTGPSCCTSITRLWRGDPALVMTQVRSYR